MGSQYCYHCDGTGEIDGETCSICIGTGFIYSEEDEEEVDDD